MTFTKPVEYALRALTYLASAGPGRVVMAKDIAADTGIPPHYLAKILQELARAGVLDSLKGPSGGFRLEERESKMSLFAAIRAMSPEAALVACPAGIEPCTAVSGCGLHEEWMKARSCIVEYLQGTTLAHAGAELTRKRQTAERRKARAARGKRP